MDRERHGRIHAVHAAAGCVHEVAGIVVPATLEDVHEADDIAVYIGVRIFKGVAHARLGGQVDYRVKAVPGK